MEVLLRKPLQDVTPPQVGVLEERVSGEGSGNVGVKEIMGGDGDVGVKLVEIDMGGGGGDSESGGW